jgi:hypothetical protein
MRVVAVRAPSGGAGLEDTGITVPDGDEAQLMQGHNFNGTAMSNVPAAPITAGAGALFSTTNDILKWLDWRMSQPSPENAETLHFYHAACVYRDGLIQLSLRNHLHDPFVVAERTHSIRLGDGGDPWIARGSDDGLGVVEDSEIKEGFSEIEPNPLDGIEFGTVGRQECQSDVVGDDEGAGVVVQGFSEMCKKQVHDLGVESWQHEGEVVAGGRATAVKM